MNAWLVSIGWLVIAGLALATGWVTGTLLAVGMTATETGGRVTAQQQAGPLRDGCRD